MAQLIDQTGMKYGKLIVLYRTPKPITRGDYETGAFWLCQCDCGNKVVVSTHQMKSGNTLSCGCDSGISLPYGESSFNEIYGKYKRSAEIRNLEWNITKEQFRELTTQPCFYCGVMPSQGRKKAHGNNGYFKYNGLDRMDNKIGYVYSNLIPCCFLHNKMKGSMSFEEFIGACISVAEHAKDRMDNAK